MKAVRKRIDNNLTEHALYEEKLLKTITECRIQMNKLPDQQEGGLYINLFTI